MKALGMIETTGLIGAIEAADVATKTANVEILNKHFISAGIVTLEITGDIGAVKVAIEAAVEATKKLGVFMSSNVIARPGDSIANLILGDLKNDNLQITKKIEKTVEKEIKLEEVKPEEIKELKKQTIVEKKIKNKK
ncbi:MULTISPECIES: BMC domain-containing protein [Psychrilyobacter]|uniref:BMC domain-containing protein n=1 Tax=Psychrilyobacter piezotolerans TaxID=2293438 RepID=A0ABX9KG02_9FUSO|nr:MULTISPECIES: BMC domain-containing protein [Psychrilyobacter]MCS5422397.1 BMC domain-containing protein [Psychrilyobacter sp. S5]NDI78413.1 BMC domain-containing protein [Psychrilyobacter piezotolerans]RDE61138.1 BMC domain-containing protein [Psychrilyobacter sp. S5]REI40779.1 BMC domain-containing protein [Psychrilyobacter piezotolerans]